MPPRLVQDFEGPTLDEDVWLPSYFPAWSSRAESAATYSLDDGVLRLFLPAGGGHWCPDTHAPPLRVSGIQSGNFSGPAGSTVGQQPFREGLQVAEAQPRFEGHLHDGGRLEIRCRMTLSPRSMAAFWLVGFEDEPQRCGELCVTEVFGRSIEPGRSAEVGMGVHRFRDPGLVEDFEAPRLDVDVDELHRYAVTWDREVAVFSLDGQEVRRCRRPPAYPMQMELAVFDFPEWSTGADDHLVPELVVDWIRGD